ncbi:MAG: zinc-binding dehydrogenase [Thermoanaerobaculia bacterium]|nr:zinc-binding dehydrogenase [Thermoanaerobaculia bacterium]
MVRAAVMPAPGEPIQVRDFETPELEPGGALLETYYSEVCGTDVHLHEGRLAGVPYPIVPGHLSVGRIVESNGQLTDVEGRTIAVGTDVTFLDVHETCNRCWHCLVAKATTRCPSRRVYGVTYSAEDGLLGGWAEQIYLKPGVQIVPLPEGVTPRLAIAGGCALPTAMHAIERAEIRLGDSVLVQGAGPVGLTVAALALLSGAGRVWVIDRHQSRLETAETLGIDEAIAIDDHQPANHVERLLELSAGRGADITIEATGSPAAIPEGIAMTRDGGRYAIVGHYTDAGEISLNPHLDINRKHLEIRGVWGSELRHLYRGIGVLARHGATLGGVGGWEQLISRTYSLYQTEQALDDVRHGRVVKAVIDPKIRDPST